LDKLLTGTLQIIKKNQKLVVMILYQGTKFNVALGHLSSDLKLEDGRPIEFVLVKGQPWWIRDVGREFAAAIPIPKPPQIQSPHHKPALNKPIQSTSVKTTTTSKQAKETSSIPESPKKLIQPGTSTKTIRQIQNHKAYGPISRTDRAKLEEYEKCLRTFNDMHFKLDHRTFMEFLNIAIQHLNISEETLYSAFKSNDEPKYASMLSAAIKAIWCCIKGKPLPLVVMRRHETIKNKPRGFVLGSIGQTLKLGSHRNNH